jgi:hypothetical protein
MALGMFVVLQLLVLICRIIGIFKLQFPISVASIIILSALAVIMMVYDHALILNSVKTLSSYSFKLRLDHIVFIGIFLSTIFLPIYENDTLEYIGVARQLDLSSFLLNYPPIHATYSHPLYASSSHPLIFHFLIMLVLPLNSGLFTFKILISLLVFWTFKAMGSLKYYSFFIVCTSQLYVTTFIGNHIDPLRLLAVVIAVQLIVSWLENDSKIFAVFLGIFLPCSVHSSGLLLSLCFLVALFTLSPQKFLTLISKKRNILLLFIVILLFCNQYLINFISQGFFVSDSTELLNMDLLHYNYYVGSMRYMTSFWETFLNSFLGSFVNFSYYGVSFLLAAISLFAHKKGFWTKSLSYIFLRNTLYAFFLIFFVTICFGIDVLSKSPRYPLMMIPIAALLFTNSLGARR